MNDLGARLRCAGFLPLPLVNDDGDLVGTQLWRARGPGIVECLHAYRSGLGLAVRAAATFDYARPLDYGRVLDHRFGRAVDALAWLVLSPPEFNDSKENL